MAISLAYGVIVGTGFILLLFPVIILTLNDTKIAIKHLWTGTKPNPEEIEVAIKDSKRMIE